MEWSLSEYNFIVYGNSDIPIFTEASGSSRFPRARLFEHTKQPQAGKYHDNIASLEMLPTLVVAELGHTSYTPAFFGRISNLKMDRSAIQFDFQHLYDRFSSEEVFSCGHFDINISDRQIDERSREHWAVKEGNLIEGVLRLIREQSSRAKPRLFQTAQWPLPVLRHNAAVMMPFRDEFIPVYDAIKLACNNQRFHAVRVDEIYRPTRIVDDIFSVIAQSRFVISDLTGRNPNVLYETGLAHALDRDVIIIVQEGDDVPFDLRAIRYIKYQPDANGLVSLQTELERYLRIGNSP